MPVRRKRSNAASPEPVSSEEKIARLLGMLLVTDMESNADKIRALRAAGFSVVEVAQLLALSEGAVVMAEHRAKKQGARRR